MKTILLNLFLVFVPDNGVWRCEPIFVVPSAYVLEQRMVIWNFPRYFRYGFNKNLELSGGAMLYSTKGDYWNYHGIIGLKWALWDDDKGKPVGASVGMEANGWGSISGRYLAGLQGYWILSKSLWHTVTIHTFANYGWNNFGKSLGPLDFYLDKMKLKIVPILGFGLRSRLSNGVYLLGDGIYARGEFYRLGEKRWSKENLFGYGIGMGFKVNIKQKPGYFRVGICFAPRQAYTEYPLQTKMVEEGKVRSFRNMPWGWYKIYLGFSLLIKRGEE